MKCVHYIFYKQKIFGNFWSTVNKNETALIFSIWIHFFKEKKLKLAKFVNFNEILCFFFFFFQIGSASGMFMKVFQVSEPKNEFSFSTMFIVFELHTFFFPFDCNSNIWTKSLWFTVFKVIFHESCAFSHEIFWKNN